MFEVDGERNDFHGAAAVALVEALARDLGDVKFYRLVEPVDGVIHARQFCDKFSIIRHQRGDGLPQHRFDDVAHAQSLPGRAGKRN